MTLYGDTSALAKLFLEEQGSPDMRTSVAGTDRVVSVGLIYVQLRAALAAAIRDRRLPSRRRDDTVADLDRFWDTVFTIAADDTLLREAGDLAEQMRLRAYDAVQLAALRTAGDPGEVMFACWDNDLRSAAKQLGYTVMPA